MDAPADWIPISDPNNQEVRTRSLNSRRQQWDQPIPPQHPQQFQNENLYPNVENSMGYMQPNAPVDAPSYAGYAQNAPMNRRNPQTANDLLAQNPAAQVAMSYGQTFFNQGSELVGKKLEDVAGATGVDKIKFYFAVDNAYVARKLGMLFMPFIHKDWSLKFKEAEEQDGKKRKQPVAPRFDVNCPDLYIPTMALATFILIAGWCLTLKGKFTPEQLSIQLSRALAWLAFEVMGVFFMSYLLAVRSTRLSFIHILIFCGYKYVAMVAVLLASVVFKSNGYYAATIYSSIAVSVFILKAMKIYILDEVSMGEDRSKRILLLAIALFQAIMIYWLTVDLAHLQSGSFEAAEELSKMGD